MKVRMRVAAVIFSFALAGCMCTPSAPKSVTLRLKNTSRSPVWVSQTNGSLGMEVQRGLSGGYHSFEESPACGCMACDVVCDGPCGCAPPIKWVQNVQPGQSLQREWNGVVQIDTTAGCGGFGGTPCQQADNKPHF